MNARTSRLIRRAALAGTARDPRRSWGGVVKMLKRAWRATPWHLRHALRRGMKAQLEAWRAAEAELVRRDLPGTTS